MLNVPIAASLNAPIMCVGRVAIIVNVKLLKRPAFNSAIFSETSERNPN